jgi:RHS repeat-associated protein
MKLLCRYQYDPLDRLTGLQPLERSGIHRFYQGNDLVNEIAGQEQLTIMRNEAQPMAQRLSVADVAKTTLLATDQQHSVLQARTATDTQHLAYTAYGHHPVESGLSSLLGFNGERTDALTGHYLLGQGNRAFNPVLMRFNSPDDLSPFGDGGINAYAYCGNDPINRYDPSGNSPVSKLFLNRWVYSSPKLKPNTVSHRVSQTSQTTKKSLETAILRAVDKSNFSIQTTDSEKIIVPYERPVPGAKPPLESLKRQGRDRRKFTGIAQALDQLVRKERWIQVTVVTKSLAKFSDAQKNLKAPLAAKVPKKRRQRARESFREARLQLKSRITITTEETAQAIRTD